MIHRYYISYITDGSVVEITKLIKLRRSTGTVKCKLKESLSNVVG